MRALINWTLRYWPAWAFATSAAMLATAHGFQSFGGYAPCTLCLRQREVYWVALVVAAAAFGVDRIARTRRAAPWIGAVLTLVFLTGAYIAIYHAGAEWKWWPGPTACSGGDSGGASLAAMSKFLAGGKIKPPSCDVAAWRLFGLSMAGWNALISLKLAGWSGAWALHRRTPRA